MSKQGLDIAPPPRKAKTEQATTETPASSKAKPPAKKEKKPKVEKAERSVSFENVAGEEKVQFNKRVTRNTADGFEMLAIKTRKKIPQLLDEALEMLEGKYGKS